MYFAKDFKIKAAHKFEFGCGFYFCVIGVLKYIIGFYLYVFLISYLLFKYPIHFIMQI